jgi:hypothetical protein
MAFYLVFLFLLLKEIGAQETVPVDTAVLYPTEASLTTQFGWSVAVSQDGTRVLVGATSDDIIDSNAGSAYIFDLVDGNFTLFDILYPTYGGGPAEFGWSVALSYGGTRAGVGALGDDTMGAGAGAAYIFIQGTGDSNFTLVQTFYPANGTSGLFGYDVDIASNGAQLFIGASSDDTFGPNAGAVYIYDEVAVDNFTLVDTLFPNVTGAQFGTSIAVAESSGYVLVGAPNEPGGGAAYLYDAGFTLLEKLYPTATAGTPDFGQSVALSGDGLRAVVGAYRDDTAGPNAGQVYIFEDPTWTVVESLLPVNGSGLPEFGFAVAITADGFRIVVGSVGDDTEYSGAGSTAIFDKRGQNDNFTLVNTLYPTTVTDGPTFGHDVAMSSKGGRIFIGAILEDTFGPDDGAAFWFSFVTRIDDEVELTTGDPLIITGDLEVGPNATVTVIVDGQDTPAIIVTGCATFGGTLVLDVSQVEEDQEDVKVVDYDTLCPNYTPFSEVTVRGEEECASTDTSSSYGSSSLDVLVSVDSEDCKDDKQDIDTRLIIGGVLGGLAVGAYVTCICMFVCALCILFVATPVIGAVWSRIRKRRVNRMDTVQFSSDDCVMLMPMGSSRVANSSEEEEEDEETSRLFHSSNSSEEEMNVYREY